MSNEKATKPQYILLKISDRSSFLIGFLLEETELEVVLQMPVVMSMIMDESDEVSIAASKWFPFCVNDIVQIPKDSIIAVGAPKPNIIAHYKKFLLDTPELLDGTLEDEVIERSVMTEKAVAEVWAPSSAVH